jgi:hypothetical protein
MKEVEDVTELNCYQKYASVWKLEFGGMKIQFRDDG